MGLDRTKLPDSLLKRVSPAERERLKLPKPMIEVLLTPPKQPKTVALPCVDGYKYHSLAGPELHCERCGKPWSEIQNAQQAQARGKVQAKAHRAGYSLPVVLAFFKETREHIFYLPSRTHLAILLTNGESRTAFNGWLSEVQDIIQAVAFRPEILFQALLFARMEGKELSEENIRRDCLRSVRKCFPAKDDQSSVVLFELPIQAEAKNKDQWQRGAVGDGQRVRSQEDLRGLWGEILRTASTGAARRWEVLFKQLPVQLYVITP